MLYLKLFDTIVHLTVLSFAVTVNYTCNKYH